MGKNVHFGVLMDMGVIKGADSKYAGQFSLELPENQI